MKKIIHINPNKIRDNMRTFDSERQHVILVQTDFHAYTGDEIEIKGPSKIIYRPHKPLPCGARVWVETDADVFVDGVEVLE